MEDAGSGSDESVSKTESMDVDDSQTIDKPSSLSKAERNSETAKFELPESLNNVLKKAESISHCLAAGDIDTPGSL